MIASVLVIGRTRTTKPDDAWRAQSRIRNMPMELADIGKTFRRLDYETKVTGQSAVLGGHERAGHVPRQDSAQSVPACAHQTHRYFEGAESARRRGGADARRYSARRGHRTLLRSGVQRSNDRGRGESPACRRSGGGGCGLERRCGGRSAALDRSRLRGTAGGFGRSRSAKIGRDPGARVGQTAEFRFRRSG